MTDTPHTSADLAGVAVNAIVRIARNRFRWALAGIAVLIVVAAILSTTVVGQRGTIEALQKKSAEQTIAEVQLRGDLTTATNNLAALRATSEALANDHGESVKLFCLLLTPEHVSSPIYLQYCKG